MFTFGRHKEQIINGV